KSSPWIRGVALFSAKRRPSPCPRKALSGISLDVPGARWHPRTDEEPSHALSPPHVFLGSPVFHPIPCRMPQPLGRVRYGRAPRFRSAQEVREAVPPHRRGGRGVGRGQLVSAGEGVAGAGLT